MKKEFKNMSDAIESYTMSQTLDSENCVHSDLSYLQRPSYLSVHTETIKRSGVCQ